jgi:hypothetical protein
LSPPNKIDIVLQKSGVAVARGRVDVAGLLGDTSRPVTEKAVRIAEMLSDLDSLLGIETFMPDAVSQEDTDTLTWAWTLAKGEGIEASWTEGRVVVEDPEVLIASVNRGDVLSYNKKLWMLDLLKGATYPPSW